MPEAHLRQSPLAHLHLASRAQSERGEAGISLIERKFRGYVNLRVDADLNGAQDGVESALGVHLPTEANTTAAKGRTTVLWLGPDEWLVVQNDDRPNVGPNTAEKLETALDGLHRSVVDVSHNYACIGVEGPAARDVIAKGCPLDLHPRVFATGRCAQSHLGKSTVILHQVSDSPAFDIVVRRSLAEYIWLYLEDSAREYGVAVLEE